MTITLPRNDLLIKKARIGGDEEDYSSEHGFPQSRLLEGLQDASDYCHMYLVNERCEAFATYKEVSANGLEYISVPSDCFLPHLIYDVWYSYNGIAGNYCEPLERMYERANPLLSGMPDCLLVDDGKIYFNRMATTGTFRIRYEKAADVLELRRGQVTAIGGTVPSVTSITIDTTDTEFYNSEDWDPLPEYLSINDRDGVVLMRDIPVDDYDSGTGVITLDTFTAQSGETLPVGSWVLFGPSSTTHCKLPRCAMAYFKEYMKTVIFEGRSQDDLNTANPRLMSFLAQIAEVYSQLPSGFMGIPQRRGY